MTSNEIIKRKREEYEMQLFGFHSSIVYATLKSMIDEQMRRRLSKLFDFIENKYKEQIDDDTQRWLRDKKKLTKAYHQGTRYHLPAIENCVKRVINIPQHVLLEEDMVQSTQYTEIQYKNAECKLKDLQLKIKQAQMMNAFMKEELEIANDFEENIETVNSLCDVIEAQPNHQDVGKDLIKLLECHHDLKQNLEQPVDSESIYRNISTTKPSVHVDKRDLEFY